MEPGSIWGTSVHCTWEMLFPDKLLCYVNTTPQEKRVFLFIAQYLGKDRMGNNGDKLLPQFAGFRTAFKIICEPAFLLCMRVCIKAARWQQFESPLVGLHCPLPWCLMMQRNQDSLRILSPLQQFMMNGNSPFVPFFMAKASATMAKSVHGDVASGYQQE